MSDLEGVEIGIMNRAASEDMADVGMDLMKRQLTGEIEAKGLTLLSEVKAVMNGPNRDLVTGETFWNVGAYARVLSYE